MITYLFNEDELREMNLSEKELSDVMLWDARRVSYLFNSHHRGTQWEKFITWTVKSYMGERRMVNLLDFCEYVANKYGATIDKVMRAVREAEPASDFYFTGDCLGVDVIERAH